MVATIYIPKINCFKIWRHAWQPPSSNWEMLRGKAYLKLKCGSTVAAYSRIASYIGTYQSINNQHRMDVVYHTIIT